MSVSPKKVFATFQANHFFIFPSHNIISSSFFSCRRHCFVSNQRNVDILFLQRFFGSHFHDVDPTQRRRQRPQRLTFFNLFLPTYLHTYLPTYLPTFIPMYLPRFPMQHIFDEPLLVRTYPDYSWMAGSILYQHFC